MSPFAIYSKTGKGVQEASGKTNLLERADRAVLAIVDGRASVADLHERYGKIPESQFNAIVEKLEAEGFIRQVSAGKSASTGKAGGDSASLDEGTDLDFTSLGSAPISRPPPVDLAARARAEAERRRRDEMAARQARQEVEARVRAQAEAKSRAEAEARARAQAEAKARADAEARARSQAEAKARAERDAALKAAAEAKSRAEAEAKARAEAEARERAAREGAVRAAIEAKTRAEAELTAKLEAEREAREELERKLREQAERLSSESREVRQDAQSGKVLSEVEELRRRLEEKRRARDDAERSAAGVGVHADAAGERIKRDADDLRERLANEARERERAEAERRTQEEEGRRAQEDAEGRAREEEEERRKSLEESSRKVAEEANAAEVERARKEEEDTAKRAAEEREWKEQAERLRREQEEMQRSAEEEARKSDDARRAKQDEEKKKKFLETQTLFADLNAFSEKEVVVRPDPIPTKPPVLPQEKKPAPAAKSAPAAPATVPPKAKVDAPPAKAPAGDNALRRELKTAAKLKAREDRRAQRHGESGSVRAKEVSKAPPPPKKEQKPKPPPIDWKKVADRSKQIAQKGGVAIAAASRQAAQGAKVGYQWSKRTYAKAQAYRRARAEQAEKIAKQKAKERDEAKAAADAAAAASAAAAAVTGPATSAPPVSRSPTVAPAAVSARRRPKAKPARWGARIVGGIMFLLVVAGGVIHVLPLETAPYEKALSDALGQPVRIGSATGWLVTGPQLRFERVRIGDDIRVGAVHAAPDLLALLSGELRLGRVELEGAVIPMYRLGGALFGAAQGGTLKSVRVVAHGTSIEGPLKVPALDADILVGADGRVGSGTVRGPDALNVKLIRKDGGLGIEGSADKFAVPFVPGLELGQFTVAGTATPQALVLSAWDGTALGGVLSGNANVRWTDGWSIEGTIKARAMEAEQFAPTLVSEGRTNGQGAYSMRSGDASALASTARIQGKFSIAKGTLAKIDLSRAVQTGGAQAVGRTPFMEMSGDVTYDRGAVVIRNARLVTGGALNAEASLEITPTGSVSGGIVAELTGRGHTLRTPVRLAGTLANLQVGQQP